MNTQEFLELFKSTNSILEFTKNANTVISENEAISNKTDNIYYIAGVDKNKKYVGYNRAGELDITEKNYCVIDLDFRKNFLEKYNEEITDNDIIQEGINIAENLNKEDSFLGNIDLVVFSGNGLHFYFFGDYKNIEPNIYSFGNKYLYNLWNNFFGDNVYFADPACKNISRILRLPGSVNQKNGSECKVIYFKKGIGKVFNSLEEMATLQKQKEEIEKQEQIKKRVEEYQKKEQMNCLIYGKKYKDKKEELEELFNIIDNVPAYIIAEKLIPFKLNKNGKNFDNEKKGFCGYYYVEDINAICNGGSRHFNWGDVNSCFSPSVLVKNFYNYTWGETINFFRKNKFINNI